MTPDSPPKCVPAKTRPARIQHPVRPHPPFSDRQPAKAASIGRWGQRTDPTQPEPEAVHCGTVQRTKQVPSVKEGILVVIATSVVPSMVVEHLVFVVILPTHVRPRLRQGRVVSAAFVGAHAGLTRQRRQQPAAPAPVQARSRPRCGFLPPGPPRPSGPPHQRRPLARSLPARSYPSTDMSAAAGAAAGATAGASLECVSFGRCAPTAVAPPGPGRVPHPAGLEAKRRGRVVGEELGGGDAQVLPPHRHQP